MPAVPAPSTPIVAASRSIAGCGGRCGIDAAICAGQGEQQRAAMLGDVTVGMAINVQTSPRDSKSVTSLHAWMQSEQIKGIK